ncbi:hypothetical protein BJV74DRAFT_807409 [Russula compacta]|nr:hypothetical protein BJV74DRAFT_807409 [Russula compacta]
MKKEQIINDPRVPLEHVKMVERDSDKLLSGNDTLQMYINNLTLQMAKRRSLPIERNRYLGLRCIVNGLDYAVARIPTHQCEGP